MRSSSPRRTRYKSPSELVVFSSRCVLRARKTALSVVQSEPYAPAPSNAIGKRMRSNAKRSGFPAGS